MIYYIYIYMTAFELRLCHFMVEGEMTLVDNYVGRGKIQMIPQNDGGSAPIILSYSLHFSPADKGVNACHFALHHTRANVHFLMQFRPFLNKKKWQNPPPLIRKNMHLRSWHAPDMVACQVREPQWMVQLH